MFKDVLVGIDLSQEVSCSMLAVKPSSFQCPVTLDKESERRRAEGPYL
ncbi:MAG TPA: hypothetical protein VND64_01315 [Pirellulales bacterium]|nr:hypothetical protein [Pirellulales bacterium]